MNQGTIISVAALLPFLTFGAEVAPAQEAKDLVGAWEQVGNISTNAQGEKRDAFGSSPKGQALFTNDGRFAVILHRADLPKFAGNNRLQGTPEEYKTIVTGSIALYGSFTVEDKTLHMKVEGSTFPNWVGTIQKRPIPKLTTDEMVFTNSIGSSGGQNEVSFKRIK